jgi:hypothetical protein
LEKQLQSIPVPQGSLTPQRSDRALLEEILNLVRPLNRPQQAPSNPQPEDQNLIWVNTKKLYDVSEDEIVAMSTQELERYFGQMNRRWSEICSFISTHPPTSPAEERFIEGRKSFAEKELARRKSSTASPDNTSVPSSTEDGA